MLRSYLRIDDLGRGYMVGDGSQNCTHESRSCGFEGLSVGEIDIIVAFYRQFVESLRVEIPLDEFVSIVDPIVLSILHITKYRKAVADYYSIDLAESQEIFTRLPFSGSIQPDEE